ncbi:GntR family transcriptional regulator [Aurantibacter crassamenti]|uniref:GntR family transcriptional regulator n=1 Tax=Aurantibacter crassamenti TaxID=1837375 RepID=UPI0019393522|nr:GntR family transcriptional regulator [Aurantibacter crassamenti]MBM1106253.1 GntR family transcriptional regulator [Aurantibacter crassamenti]
MKSGIPKYKSISKEIIQKIESGEFQPGDKVPSENELIDMYEVSNTTARKSLLEVELEGWAKRIKGKGTFVLNRSEDRHITRVLGPFHAVKESFNENLIREGFTPRNVVLEKTILDDGISSNINNHHYIIKGPVLKIHRLRYADDILLKDEVRYISLTLCPKINMHDLDNRSLISMYENIYDLQLKNVERTLGNTIIYPLDQKYYFENEIPMAVFVLDGAIFCNDGEIVEMEQSYYRGDKYKFSIVAKPQFSINKN